MAEVVSSSRYQPSWYSRPGVAGALPFTPSRPRRYPPSGACGASSGAEVGATARVSRLRWQLSVLGQPMVTVLLPAARLTGTATVRHESQLLVGASVTVLGAAPA